jgi:hypothetical protein
MDVADWRDSIYKARRGKLAWRPLVVLLILISIIEAALAAAGRRAAPRRVGSGRLTGELVNSEGSLGIRDHR